MSPSPTVVPTVCVPTGDVNGDSAVTPADAQQAFMFYIDCAGQNPTAYQYCMADYCTDGENAVCDGSVTPGDALAILRNYLQLPDPCAK